MKGNLKTQVKSFVKSTGRFMKRNKTTILTIAGIGLGVVTVIEAVKATPAATMDVEDAKFEKEQKGEKFTKWDTIKVAAPHYALSAVTGAGAITCHCLAQKFNLETIAELGAMVKTGRETIQAIKAAEREQFGEKKANAIQEKADQKIVENKIQDCEVYPEDGMFLCYDFISGRFFKSSYEILAKAELKLKNEFDTFGEAALDLFYDEVHLKTTDLSDGVRFHNSPEMLLRVHKSEDAVDPAYLVVDWRDEPTSDNDWP